MEYNAHLAYCLVAHTVSGTPAPQSHVAPITKASANLLFSSSSKTAILVIQ